MLQFKDIYPIFYTVSLLLFGNFVYTTVHANNLTGTVKFFVDADSSFDRWTRNPSAEEELWMRNHYHRMQTYSSYFDDRLSWYPNAWFYKDSYAIKPDWSVFQEHPEWILRDEDNAMLFIPFNCANGICPQYAADFGNPDFRAWWVNDAKSKMELGYKGIWIDDVNLDWRVSNGNGDFVAPIDPRTNLEMTLEDWRRYFVEFMELVRDELPNAEIAHNIIWYALPQDDPVFTRMIVAANYINLERGITDRGITAGTGKYGFETFMGLIDKAHALNRNVIMDDDDDTSVVDRDYELSFYYLITDGGDMLGADGDRSRMSPDSFWPNYDLDLGQAISAPYKWNNLFRRDFECGIVLVNQPENSTVAVSLGENLTNLAGNLTSSAELPAASGQVLVRSCASKQVPLPPTELNIHSPQ